MGDQEDFTQLPLQEQFAHKNWKARKGGYETAAREFKTAQPNDPIVKDFVFDSGLWKGAVGDSNVAAQQEALTAYNAFLDAAGAEGAKRTRAATVQPIVEKGLTGRPAAKAAALESLLLLIELDKSDPVVEELLPLVGAKVPKVIVAALSALKDVVHAYGCKVVEPKPVLKLLPKAYGHADKNVRAEAQALTVELYRWLREAMKPLFWGELKEVQQKDLDKLFEPIKAEPAPKQERLLRSQQAAAEAAEAAHAEGNAAGEGEGDEEAGIDLEPEFEAVDVMPKIPKDYQERLASSKWKDRKEALDDIFAAVNVPAIKEAPFDDIVRGCAKSMKDANIAVVTVAANVIESLAKGLKKAFGRYRATILPAMLERFKEKKASVTDAIGAACDAVFAATSLADVQPDVDEALKSKNPQVKENTAKFLIRSLKTTKQVPTPEQTKEISESAKKLITESVASLRDAGAEILGVLWKIMGDRNMLNHLDGLDDIRKNKVKEFSDAAEVRVKWKPKAAAPPPKPAGGAAANKKPTLGGKRPASAVVKKPAAPVAKRAPTPELEEPDLKPRPTSGILKKPAGLRPPATSGLKPPSGLAKPATGLKPPASGTSSPKRQTIIYDEAPPQTPAKSGLAGPGRGLAGRPLGKPAAPPASPPAASRPEPVQSALSQIERQELADLRQEVEVMRQQASDLRNDKMRLTSQITELQNQNAQLIEDHTRDVLQIKAKETQLVRARSDAETAEERANSLSREVDRLKREMKRIHRHNSSIDSTANDAETPNDRANGFASDMSAVRPTTHTSRSFNTQQPSRFQPEYPVTANGGDKENVPEDRPTLSKLGSRSNTLSSPTSGRSTSMSVEDGGSSNNTIGRASTEGNGAGVESWRRAAEVTQNLKARIEMMKASRSAKS